MGWCLGCELFGCELEYGYPLAGGRVRAAVCLQDGSNDLDELKLQQVPVESSIVVEDLQQRCQSLYAKDVYEEIE